MSNEHDPVVTLEDILDALPSIEPSFYDAHVHLGEGQRIKRGARNPSKSAAVGLSSRMMKSRPAKIGGSILPRTRWKGRPLKQRSGMY